MFGLGSDKKKSAKLLTNNLQDIFSFLLEFKKVACRLFCKAMSPWLPWISLPALRAGWHLEVTTIGQGVRAGQN